MAPAENLREARERVVREHMDSENRLDFAATLATFSHPRYELMATSEVFDGPDAVMGYYRALRTAVPDQQCDVARSNRVRVAGQPSSINRAARNLLAVMSCTEQIQHDCNCA